MRHTPWINTERNRFARWRGVGSWFLSVGMLLVPFAALAGGGEPATRLVNVADTRALEPGITRFVADVYNESYWLFGLLVVAVMSVMGLALGIVADRLVELLGIDLGKLDHHE